MMKTRATRAMTLTSTLMSGIVVASLTGLYYSGEDGHGMFFSTVAVVAAITGSTTFLAAQMKAHLRPMAVAWHLGVKTAQRQAVEQRQHLKAVD